MVDGYTVKVEGFFVGVWKIGEYCGSMEMGAQVGVFLWKYGKLENIVGVFFVGVWKWVRKWEGVSSRGRTPPVSPSSGPQ